MCTILLLDSFVNWLHDFCAVQEEELRRENEVVETKPGEEEDEEEDSSDDDYWIEFATPSLHSSRVLVHNINELKTSNYMNLL